MTAAACPDPVKSFVVSPLAIWLSLLDTNAHPTTKLFFGWIGPRGLAKVLFALQVIDALPYALGEDTLRLTINGVWISAIPRGISAARGGH